ncbi:hypothetical protein HPP92_000760 [Vanilla planifolia]|uniref:Homeobox domain-containing protein n=1 Tax=Vanilla planifolia TaxID=51239 RepID=A0A835RQH8_VANPL|nr:hypothetical protein HPP92_000760 [Vanilla planifolia]
MCESSCSCAEHMREGCLTRKDDISGCSHASRCSYSKLHDVSLLINILQNSPYLEPARQLLDEVVCVSDYFKLSLSGKSDGFNHCKENSQTVHLLMEKQFGDIRLTKLTALREEVFCSFQLEVLCRRYFLQMDELVTAFETIAGAGAAAAYTALTIQAMSKHFSNLRHAIIAKIDSSKESRVVVDSKDKPKRAPVQRLGMNQVKHIWRPLRGLPEESVLVLRGWLFEHFLHPYPSDKEKLLLASQTGLTRNQISNWFINARVRLWKPMIEEMYRESLVM